MEERRKSARRAADRDLLMVDRRGVFATADGDRRRRRTVRYQCMAVIEKLVGRGAPPPKARSRVLDISLDGARLFTQVVTEVPFVVGQEMRVGIELAGGATVETRAEVRWVKAIPQRDGFACGVHFKHVDVSDQKRILRFLKELDETMGL